LNTIGLWLGLANLVLLVVLLLRLPGRGRAGDSKQPGELRDALARIEGTSLRIDRALSDLLPQQKEEIRQGWDGMAGRMQVSARELRDEVGSSLALARSEASTQQAELKRALEACFGEMRQELGRVLEQSDNRLEGGLRRFSDSVRDLSEKVEAGMRRSSETVEQRLAKMSETAESRGDRLREAVERKLAALEISNTAKLEEMRSTVDEKLHSTLNTRLTESFGMVTEQLGRVQSGLGEMKELATGVGDLKRVLTNVKVRGGFAEVQLGMQLEQVLSSDQYRKNVNIDPATRECVEFAIRLPNADAEVLLPIDAKFPREDWERLEDASQRGDASAMAAAAQALETTLRGEARKIGEKYVRPPKTTNFAVMFLPTEGLFAEAVKRPGLVDELQSKYRVCIAGPTTFMALLNSLQMGFRTLAIQQKGVEVWRVLAATKVQFEKFGDLMGKVQKQVGTVQSTIGSIRSKTNTISRALRSVDALEMSPVEASSLLGLEAEQETEAAAEAGDALVSEGTGDPS
jgi:DNA recombination protein RmuC